MDSGLQYNSKETKLVLEFLEQTRVKCNTQIYILKKGLKKFPDNVKSTGKEEPIQIYYLI